MKIFWLYCPTPIIEKILGLQAEQSPNMKKAFPFFKDQGMLFSLAVKL